MDANTGFCAVGGVGGGPGLDAVGLSRTSARLVGLRYAYSC